MAYLRVFIIAFCLSSFNSIVSGVSSFGKEFYIGIPGNFAKDRNNTIQLDFASKKPGEIQMIIPFLGYNETRPINRHLKIMLSSLLEMFSTGKENSGIYIKSTDLIAVFVTSTNHASGGTFLAFPLESLGTEYDVIAYPSGWKSGYPSEVVFVAPYDETTVTMIHGQNSSSVRLNRLDVYQMETSTEDLTMGLVTSDKPIALFTAASCDVTPNINHRCNMDFAQWLPVAKYGKSTIIPPIAFYKPMEFLLYSLNNSVNICLDNAPMIGHYCSSVFRGRVLFGATKDKTVTAHADGRFLAILYKEHETFVTLVPGIEHFLTEYYVVYPEVYRTQSHFMTITVPKAAMSGLRLDGGMFSQPLSVVDVSSPFEAYTVLTYQVSTTGYHSVTHRDGNITFGVLCYGYDNHTVTGDGSSTYGFPAGLHLGLPLLDITCENRGTLLGDACICPSRFAGDRCQTDADCTFDADTVCNWTNIHSGDNFDWVVYHSTTPSDDTGPTNDHTFGTSRGNVRSHRRRRLCRRYRH
ncbi:uncharacterized protein LOC127859010 isoform X2 [Dreissena polymorpha]|uniref:uncharacterized protein LOC127859010 isoform X2 n=1 Tax=Dreissena polymorpha TaxID=45954 RepID=UPI002264AD7B|nr:uncharacterized protein LOC127859010 isoform X2 [Dreissena polymorpha]